VWAAAHPWVAELDPSALADLLRWIESEQLAAHQRGERFSIAGRARESVLRAVDAFRRRQLAAGAASFPPSGLPPWSDDGWSVVELGTPAALAQEGEQQRHCVGQYAPLAASGKVALFSLRRGDRRHATLEVVLATREVVQAKGACNRPCTDEELRAVRRWADASLLGTRPLSASA
jgi:hypothetical protein